MKTTVEQYKAEFDTFYSEGKKIHSSMDRVIKEANQIAHQYAEAEIYLEKRRSEDKFNHPNPLDQEFKQQAEAFRKKVDDVKSILKQCADVVSRIQNQINVLEGIEKSTMTALSGREVAKEVEVASKALSENRRNLNHLCEYMIAKMDDLSDIPEFPSRTRYVSKAIKFEIPQFITKGIKIISGVAKGVIAATTIAFTAASLVLAPIAWGIAKGGGAIFSGIKNRFAGPKIGHSVPKLKANSIIKNERQSTLGEYGFKKTTKRDGLFHRLNVFRKPKELKQTTIMDFREQHSKKHLFDPRNPLCNTVHKKKRNGFKFFKRNGAERILVNDKGVKLKTYHANEFGSEDWLGWTDSMKKQKKKFRQAPDPKVQILNQNHSKQQNFHKKKKAHLKSGMDWVENSEKRKNEALREIKSAIEKIQSEKTISKASGWKRLEDFDPIINSPIAGTTSDPVFKGYLDQVTDAVNEMTYKPDEWMYKTGQLVNDYDISNKIDAHISNLKTKMRYEGGYDSLLNDYNFERKLHDHIKRDLKGYRDQVTRGMLDDYDYKGNTSHYISSYARYGIGW